MKELALGVIDQLHKPKTQSSYRLVIHKSLPVELTRLIRDIARVKQILQNRGDRCRFVNQSGAVADARTLVDADAQGGNF